MLLTANPKHCKAIFNLSKPALQLMINYANWDSLSTPPHWKIPPVTQELTPWPASRAISRFRKVKGD